MFKASLISLELSDSDIEIAVQTWSSVENNPLVHNNVVQEVIDVMNKSVKQEEEEDKAEAQEVELSDESVVGNITVDISV